MSRLPSRMVPYLEDVRARVVGRGAPLDFWQIDSGPKILEGFMELACVLPSSETKGGDVPRGYRLLQRLFEWEAACQADGWGAFGNIGDEEFVEVCDFYREVGLSDESKSLETEMAAYREDPGDMDALQEAADETSHELSEDLDRLEWLTQYFCDHADRLLYVAQ